MRLAYVVVACLVLAAAPSAAPGARADISGDWILNFNGPQGPIDATGSFKQSGEDVTGTIDGPQGVTECSGTLKETKLALQMEVNAQGQSFQIYLLADVDGDSMKGTFSVAEMRGEWTGRKKKN
jgi:hypothetical protein